MLRGTPPPPHVCPTLDLFSLGKKGSSWCILCNEDAYSRLKLEDDLAKEWEHQEKFIRKSLEEAGETPARIEELIEYNKMTWFDPSKITLENMLKYWKPRDTTP